MLASIVSENDKNNVSEFMSKSNNIKYGAVVSGVKLLTCNALVVSRGTTLLKFMSCTSSSPNDK